MSLLERDTNMINRPDISDDVFQSGADSLEWRVLQELSDRNWDYRTVDGIAQKLEADKSVVKNILDNSSQVLQSVMSNRAGQSLYALRSRTNRFTDYIAAIRAASTYKLGS